MHMHMFCCLALAHARVVRNGNWKAEPLFFSALILQMDAAR
jgi:hypothetical protein